MRNIIKIGFSIFLLAITFTSCDELATTEDVVMDRNQKPVVNVTSSESLNLVEGEAADLITITTEYATTDDQIFKLVQISGDAVSGVDYDFDSYSALDYGVVGGKIVIPAYETTGSLAITIPYDSNDVSKDAVFELRSIQSQLGVVGAQNRVSVNMEDLPYCAFELSMTDTYGDSWNGATVTLTVNGTPTVYANENLDGETSLSETQTETIYLLTGDVYSFEFTSGDWDSEIQFELTAPNGTVFADGPSPTVGVITSGTLDCGY